VFAYVIRGQVLPASSLKNSILVELIHEAVKYIVQVVFLSVSSFPSFIGYYF